ncbi:ATP-dependent zinc metalloprotease FtsH [Serpentinicella alkaliphila]|uniref:ATP-dependent zinc metalloprotease FtsH n=1 Tax=Serpentinicella alkaliphila TaxID=1734049 RepID=A0A4V2T1E3_9FIRM|nr:ATP-dependent zinc metalloprotease FtsH [Serpentinicella alkaliphila]QUH25362.1 ATP-dependent metallopeptidase FtsH/Yme1/Tma family protein [Serpentinicella alkaliphila]TCP93333.1 cell division protease FtsH [Serpentinicella alkaliphila]
MRKFFRGASFYILIFIVLLIVVQRFSTPQQTVEDIGFSQLYKELVNGNVKEIHVVERSIEGTVIRNNEKVFFTSFIPEVFSEERFSEILENQMLEGNGLKVTGAPRPTTPWFIELLPSIFMVLIFIVFWFVFMQQSQGGGNRVMSFGKSRAKLHKEDEKKKITFDDVAGLDEEKEELEELVDFLKSPRKYIELGARIPKGILMVGPPGTGKTYLTKAVAGEAGVPFFSISGSDFVEMFVGVGASRVRDLFDQAKKNSPCIIFIDEIDAVGRRRGAGLGGGHDEREQTLNQLLVEMDGFGLNEGIIIVAATNRPDILDPALLRPGRFDRQITVGAPDIKGREAILLVHAKNKPLADDVNLKVLARRTPGFTPADIENLMNEAALLTARKSEKKIRMQTIEEAITKVIAGVEKKSKVISEKERKLTAYHEAGHAVVATLLPNTAPVHQVSIIPRGRAGGFTMILPTEDKYYATKTEMEEHIIHLLGGRVAEKLVLDDISTGAQNDLQRVASVARGMVTKYGMSEKLGPMAFGTNDDDEVFLGRDITSKRNYSEEVAAQIDQEIRKIVDTAYNRAETLLNENMDKLHTIAKALLKLETLDADQYKKIFNYDIVVEDSETVEEFEAKLKNIDLDKNEDNNSNSNEE